MSEHHDLILLPPLPALPASSPPLPEPVEWSRQVRGSWRTWASRLCLHLLDCLAPLLRSLGAVFEWLPNFFHLNGFFRTLFFLDVFFQLNGFFRTLFVVAIFTCNLITWNPPKDSPTYFSLVGWMDTRLDLMTPTTKFKETNTRIFVDLCIMASKLAYESPNVQKHVVEARWNMCFQRFLDCWNDRVQRNTTQAFIFTDKGKNAERIVVAFRGTQPFDPDDWSTDFDCEWIKLSEAAGKVNLGFLEALGLVNRHHHTTSFPLFMENCSSTKDNNLENPCSVTGLNIIAHETNQDTLLAFDAISREVCRLLKENPNAKLFLTGHSLGGALAVLFAGVLMFKENRHTDEDNILHKLSAIHTFGQPRVGDTVFATFMTTQLKAFNIDYYRIVYCNDMVSRAPFDNLYKHIGHVCYYYDSFFNEKVLKEEPNKNHFFPLYFLGMRITAIWELLRSMVMPIRYGVCFKETVIAIMLRLFFGLLFPGALAHMPTNYVSAVRLGPKILNRYVYDHA